MKRYVPLTGAERAASEARRADFLKPDSSRRFPVIASDLADELAVVQPSHPHANRIVNPARRDVEFRPCRLTLRSRKTYERVLVVEADRYKAHGIPLWPDDEGLELVPIAEVASIAQSRYRLPADLATAVWAAGERWGTYTFTLVLNDGRRLPYAVIVPDFPMLPAGVEAADCASVVVDEFPEAFTTRRPSQLERDAPFAWCLYRTA